MLSTRFGVPFSSLSESSTRIQELDLGLVTWHERNRAVLVDEGDKVVQLGYIDQLLVVGQVRGSPPFPDARAGHGANTVGPDGIAVACSSGIAVACSSGIAVACSSGIAVASEQQRLVLSSTDCRLGVRPSDAQKQRSSPQCQQKWRLNDNRNVVTP